MGKRRGMRAVACALGLAVAVALAGCSFVGQVGDSFGAAARDKAIGAALATLTTKLETIPGIEHVTSTYSMREDYTFEASVQATTAALTGEQASLATTAVARAFNDDAFAGQQTTFQLDGVDEGVSIGGSGLAAQRVAADVAYWSLLRTAYAAPLSLGIWKDAGSVYSRTISGQLHPAPIDWAALRAVHDPGFTAGGWDFPGVESSSALPTEAEAGLLAELAAVSPVYGVPTFDGVLMTLQPGVIAQVSVTSTQKTDAAPATVVSLAPLTAWPGVVAVAKVLTTSAVPVGDFSFSNNGGGVWATMHLASCDGRMTATPQDDELLTALLAAGVQLPPTAAAGICAPTTP